MDSADQSSAATGGKRGKAQAIVHYFGKLDMFRVVQDQEQCLTSATTSGAIVSLLTSFFIALLMIQETYLFFKGEIRSSMFVPSLRVQSEPMESVHLSVSFPAMPCNLVGIAIVDQHGNVLPDLMRPTTAKKMRLQPGDHTKPLIEYKEGAAVNPGEGCKLDGVIMIDKVPGHFLVGALGHRGGDRASSRHIIHEMWIGNVRLDKRRDGVAEDLVNPLGGLSHLEEPDDTMYKFYMQVVPTYFRNDNGGKVKKLGYQYTVSTTKIRAPHMPSGLYFSHKHSTLAVEYRYHYETWSHFFVGLCAIAGGVFTVMSFISSAMEAVGDTPSFTKLCNFAANYFAGRRKGAATAPVASKNEHSPTYSLQQQQQQQQQQQYSPHSASSSAASPFAQSQGSLLQQTAAAAHAHPPPPPPPQQYYSPPAAAGHYTPSAPFSPHQIPPAPAANGGQVYAPHAPPSFIPPKKRTD